MVSVRAREVSFPSFCPMELVNHTPVPATVTMVRLADGQRGGFLMAKATFGFFPGATELETQDPVPQSLEATETELGLLPPDQPLVAADPSFEVVILGCAHSPTPVGEMRVAAAVGGQRRELVVTGDRQWVVENGPPIVSSPVPFTRKPLTWERAFGGRCAIEIDEGSFVDVYDPMNPHGRGFDAEAEAARQAELLRPPPGFPRFEYRRLLPNVEHPNDRVTGPEDRPRPACWATRPADLGLRAEHVLEGDEEETPPSEALQSRASTIAAVRSAVEEWVIEPPARQTPITLEGLTPGATITFPFPALRVVVDYRLGSRSGSLALEPHQLVLLPEQSQLVVSYRTLFRTPYRPDEERSMRLRLES